MRTTLAVLAPLLFAGAFIGAGVLRQPEPPVAPGAMAGAPTFPASWAGHWKGDASVGVDGRMQRFTMELRIKATDDAKRFEWTIVYDGAAGRQERPYSLLVRDAEQGLYAIDESNGIVLDARLVAGTLYSHFLVNGNRITSRSRLEHDATGPRIDVELVTTIDDRAGETGNVNGSPAVKTWTPVAVQTAVLRRQ